MANRYTSWAFSQDISGSGRKFVLVALADCANGDGYAYPGQTTLGEMTGQSDRSVRGHLEWLEEQGYVRRAARRRKDGTRTSDAYYLPPVDADGRIFRWPTTGESFRLSEGREKADQDAVTPPLSTGKSRRLSAPRSTGRLRTSHRKNSPVDAEPTSGPSRTAQTPDYQPAESSGHEPLTTREPLTTPPTPPPNPNREEEVEGLDLNPSDSSIYNLGRGRGQTDSHLPTLHPETFKLLVTFRKLHGTKANDEMFRAWATTVRQDIHAHGEPKVNAALETTIGNFASLNFPFSFYEACLKRPTKTSDTTALDQYTERGL